jgi:glc operon protein GlcG
MTDIKDTKTLTFDGALKVLNAAIAEAIQIGQPMCIAVVDSGGNLLAFGRRDGSKGLSVTSSINKARTSALSAVPTGGAHADVEIQVTLAHGSRWTNLIGGLPIRVNGFVLGAVAAGSGSGTQDLAVARAGAAALAGLPDWNGRIVTDANNPIEAPLFKPVDLKGRVSSDVFADLASARRKGVQPPSRSDSGQRSDGGRRAAGAFLFRQRHPKQRLK